ncbi:hypothetical protein C2G38_2241995 [Gigaspora rosea]|uniref:Uncharacterized protein n=1 Tax=Gigaspora rosea TaxID=44941 RepID=A0A397VRX2_9GLOM|nr:hypothetical protein C2G38_2241995 [Gigaspora rosea]
MNKTRNGLVGKRGYRSYGVGEIAFQEGGLRESEINLVLTWRRSFKYKHYQYLHAQYEPLARLWRVNDADLPMYLTREKNLKDLDRTISKLLDDTKFGGTWIDVKANKLTINTVDFSDVGHIISLPEIRPYRNLLTFLPANNSLYQLSFVFEQIIQLAKAKNADGIFIYVDIRLNNVVIYFPPQNVIDNRDKEFIDATMPYNPIIFYENLDTPIMKRQKRGLIKRRVLCGEVTAGHCYNRDTSNKYFHMPWGSEPTTYFIGQMVYHSVLKYDFGLIEFRGTHTNPRPMIRNLDSSRYRELHMRDTTQVSSHGVHLCKSGLITQVTCGYVRAFDGISISNGLFKTDLIITDMYSYRGDSGSPVYFYSENLDTVSLNGILYGGAQSINHSNDVTAILPLDIILSQVKIKPILSL